MSILSEDKILAVVSDWRGANDASFARSFECLGNEVQILNNLQWFGDLNYLHRARMKFQKRPTMGRILDFNHSILIATERYRPDVVFIARGLWVLPETLEEIKRQRIILVHWHPDDAFNPDNSSSYFLSSIPKYDLIVTPKSFNVTEYMRNGAKNVIYAPYAYDPSIHYPVKIDHTARNVYGSDVAFVGTRREKRVRELEAISQTGIDIKIWGTGWRRLAPFSKLRSNCTFTPVYAEEMSKVFGASKIVLGFLNAENRDLHTARTFEVPACGGFLLAERTTEHLEFLREGNEADYFSSVEELIDKINFYLKNDSIRLRIAKAGYERVISIQASYSDRARFISQEINKIRG